jgi:hypothetical protein
VPCANKRAAADFRKAGFSGPASDVLTGTWLANDAGTYYLRLSDQNVVWFGEGPNSTNVFFGQLASDGKTINGQRIDVPKLPLDPAAPIDQLTLASVSLGPLQALTTPQTRLGIPTRWGHVDALNLAVSLDRLTVVQPVHGGGDQPYLMILFIKVDGDSVDTSPPATQSHVAVISREGQRAHGLREDLTTRSDVKAGEAVNIPTNIARFDSIVKTIRGLDPAADVTLDNTSVTLMVIAFAHNATVDEAIEAMRLAIIASVQSQLDQIVQQALSTFSAPSFNQDDFEAAVTAAATQAVIKNTPIILAPTLLFHDVAVGSFFQTFSFRQLRSIGQAGKSLDFQLSTKDKPGSYRITGTIRAS